MKAFKPVFFVLILFPLLSKAQYNETIRTGRPGNSIGAYALGKNVIQIQSGYNINWVEEGVSEINTGLLNNVIRLGLTERIELSSVINWQRDKFKSGPDETELSGISSTQFGGRINISQNEGMIPAICFQARANLGLRGEDYDESELQAVYILATVNRLNDNFSFTSNWILRQFGDDLKDRGFYTAALSYSISDKVGTFVEMYGQLNDDFSSNFDGGFSYLVNNDLQLDISAAYQGDENRDDYFIDFGFSWRTDWRK